VAPTQIQDEIRRLGEKKEKEHSETQEKRFNQQAVKQRSKQRGASTGPGGKRWHTEKILHAVFGPVGGQGGEFRRGKRFATHKGIVIKRVHGPQSGRARGGDV